MENNYNDPQRSPYMGQAPVTPPSLSDMAPNVK